MFALALSIAAAVSGGALAAQRTFVSSAGNDAFACSLAAPCRGFTAALAHTDQGGEIIVLDSAGYGPVTIAQSVSIVAPPGVYAGITVFSGNGITVNGAGIGVVLRGLTITGQGGSSGIVATSASLLSIERCTVSGMDGYGLDATANAIVLVRDSTFLNNGLNGLRFAAAALTASVDHTRVEGNGGSGLFAESGASVSVSESVAVSNGGEGFKAFSNGGTTRLAVSNSAVSGHLGDAWGILGFTNGPSGTVLLTVTRTTVTRNSGGVGATASGGASVVHATVSDSTITANVNDGLSVGNGAVLAASNNTIAKNGTGVSNSASTFQTRQNNMSTGNVNSISGAFTPLGGF